MAAVPAARLLLLLLNLSFSRLFLFSTLTPPGRIQHNVATVAAVRIRSPKVEDSVPPAATKVNATIDNAHDLSALDEEAKKLRAVSFDSLPKLLSRSHERAAASPLLSAGEAKALAEREILKGAPAEVHQVLKEVTATSPAGEVLLQLSSSEGRKHHHHHRHRSHHDEHHHEHHPRRASLLDRHHQRLSKRGNGLDDGHDDDHTEKKKGSSSSTPSLGGGTDLEKAMRFLNAHYKEIQEKMDTTLMDCGGFKRVTEEEEESIAHTLKQLAFERGDLNSQINNAHNMVDAATEQVDTLKERLQEKIDSCEQTKSALELEKKTIETDKRTAKVILDVTNKECASATVLLLGQQHQHQHRGRRGGEDVAVPSTLGQTLAKELGSDAAAQAAAKRILGQPRGCAVAAVLGAGGSNNSSSSGCSSSLLQGAAGEVPCGCVGVKPNCFLLIDRVGDLVGEINEQLSEKKKELADHVDNCAVDTKDLKREISEKTEEVDGYSVQLLAKNSEVSQVVESQNQQAAMRHEVCDRMRKKYTYCNRELKALEEQVCGVVKVRQATYQKLKPKAEDQEDIMDCQVGDWTPGVCSKTCNDGQDLGVLMMKREVVQQNNSIGAPCPPLEFEQDCGAAACPVDCVVGEWDGWSKCTAGCGGGSQLRNRIPIVEAEHGGNPCSETQEARPCNTGSCDQDCGLHDWTEWGPCSRSCQAPGAVAGHQSRKKHIHIATKGQGRCPAPNSRKRIEFQKCNEGPCPAGTMKCVASMDLVVLLDGSGSLWNPETGKPKKNWEQEKAFVKALVSRSVMDGADVIDQDKEEGSYPKHVRIGVVGFSNKATVIQALTGKSASVLDALTKAEWEHGVTRTHLALAAAQQLLKFSRPDRIQAVLLVTDGRATDREAAMETAQALKDRGVRVMVAPVGEGVPDDDACALASAPCVDNVEKAKTWTTLTAEIDRFIAGSCSELSGV